RGATLQVRINLFAGALLVLLAAACGAPGGVEEDRAGGAVPGGDDADALPRCDQVHEVSAPQAWYGDEPVYVGNEMPTEAVRAWAQQQPGFQDLWIDRDHNGWIAVGFTRDVAV